ncbi:hypothetical protein K7432_000953 [Basidiobolus ranarum]|uniref:SCP domain-containing protein n=1 Tax=Basidiobolus ranarum TaxID=34480 RepID=A0ABR2WAE9_9FUNG
MKNWTTLIFFTLFLFQAILIVVDARNVQVPTKGRPRKGKTSLVTVAVTAGTGNLQNMLNLVNQQRMKNGRPLLKLDSRLVQAAQKHTDYQARVGQMTHNEPGRPLSLRVSESGFRWTALGENVAMSYPSVEAVMKGWMNSPGHRQNILNPQYTHFGSGYVAKGNYWTQVFGRSA